ncbi:MAG: flagellin [Marinosulfonomonas sp.]
MQRLAQELTSGIRSDISTATSGDFRPIAALARTEKNIIAYSTAAAEAAQIASTMQASLSVVQDYSSELVPAFLLAATSEGSAIVDTAGIDAKNKFASVLSSFNTRVGDRNAFSGVTTNMPAFADATTILSSLRTATASETTAAGVVSVVDAWFDTVGGGFETDAYLGSMVKLSDVAVSEHIQVSLATTAADSDVREALKGFALGALLGDGILGVDTAQRSELSKLTGEKLLSSQSNLSELRANIGSTEAEIENAQAGNSARKTAIELTRAEMTGVDSYRTAVELEAVQTQLETLYTLTSRMSRLSLADFLR